VGEVAVHQVGEVALQEGVAVHQLEEAVGEVGLPDQNQCRGVVREVGQEQRPQTGQGAVREVAQAQKGREEDQGGEVVHPLP